MKGRLRSPRLRRRARRRAPFSQETWALHRDTIIETYRTNTIDEVIVELNRRGFFPSKCQVIGQLNRWGIKKYRRRSTNVETQPSTGAETGQQPTEASEGVPTGSTETHPTSVETTFTVDVTSPPVHPHDVEHLDPGYEEETEYEEDQEASLHEEQSSRENLTYSGTQQTSLPVSLHDDGLVFFNSQYRDEDFQSQSYAVSMRDQGSDSAEQNEHFGAWEYPYYGQHMGAHPNAWTWPRSS